MPRHESAQNNFIHNPEPPCHFHVRASQFSFDIPHRTPEEHGKMADRLTGQHIHFLSLQTSVFCVECEVISENNTPYCFACGSRAVLSLSRVLGGSLRGQQTAHLIADAELGRLVRELLRTVPASSTPAIGDRMRPLLLRGRMHVAWVNQTGGNLVQVSPVLPGTSKFIPEKSILSPRSM
jgi:hypothetical protein